ncbi:PRKCA-binding protein isoform X1 [Cimex lectularius]|uniref:PRKCA-binding protein n=1 Tax=Cimex lectularius TaxID=79782 RepID=A0A8I6RHE1_CIMLE|nr:PRKCA-binding protein isoform X1 [Cimex lectularius]
MDKGFINNYTPLPVFDQLCTGMFFPEDTLAQHKPLPLVPLEKSLEEDRVLTEGTSTGKEPPSENAFLLGQQSLYMFQDSLGMTVTSGVTTIKKDTSNLIGISIGGGAPVCPCLYIVQVFDNTPAAKEGTLQSGDELVGVNGQSVKGKTKVEVAKMIQSSKDEVSIKYNKLHADPTQGKSLDIVLKKVKHRLVENMSTSTADALGLSRAILCNDTLVKKLQELDGTEAMYRGLVDHTKRVLKAFYGLLQVYKAFGDAFAGIGVREPQPRASEAFRAFGDYHRLMEKNGVQTLKTIKPILSDLGTYLNKAIPDTKLTIRKYADAKFEYLSYCLKVKEMDDEEYSYAQLQEPLYRVETGNYEYRLILRCRQDARARFARLRSDVLVKLELLDSKHVEDVVRQLHRFASSFAKFYEEVKETLAQNSLFPIEMDLARSAFQYSSTNQQIQYEDDDDELIQDGVEVKEEPAIGQLIDGQFQTKEDKDEQKESYLEELITDMKPIQVSEPKVATLIGLD